MKSHISTTTSLGNSKKFAFHVILSSAITAITILSLQAFFIYNHNNNKRTTTTTSSSTFPKSQQQPYAFHHDHDIISPSHENNINIQKKYLLATHHLSFLTKIQHHERHIYSQYNEDGIIEYIFDNIPPITKYYVEFGTESCSECTTRHLYEVYGWDGLLIDGNGKTGDKRVIRNHFITKENIVGLFEKPNLLILEINRNFGPKDSYAVRYNSTGFWTSGHYFGQSALAATRLATSHNYIPIYIDNASINMFFLNIDWVQRYLFDRTGTQYEVDEIRLLGPTFEELYRRSEGIHVEWNDVRKFWELFKREEWVAVREDGEVVA
ncbi:hypothetical protein HDU76_001239 [Blyttiomyces sp. JEL0837]|nr:hypothetical protein HDU76_001239 [Blyttiomyces sp. JEL0837]